MSQFVIAYKFEDTPRRGVRYGRMQQDEVPQGWDFFEEERWKLPALPVGRFFFAYFSEKENPNGWPEIFYQAKYGVEK